MAWLVPYKLVNSCGGLVWGLSGRPALRALCRWGTVPRPAHRPIALGLVVRGLRAERELP